MADEYRATLHLPRTEFPMKADLVTREPEALARWEKVHLYDQLRAARQGAPRFILHDGPPFANGNAHLGHLVNNVLKDAVVRYKFMRGFDVPFIPGWDCHGQAIEHNYLKQSGLNPRDVDPLELRRACREYAMKWVRIQREQRKRVGALGAWDRPYLTMDKELTAAEISCVGRLIREGYIFRGKKPVLWCASCETALAENSVEHGPHVAPSVYVRFPVTTWPPALAASQAKSGKPAAAVIWTTTPWTLPANVAIAFNPRLMYDLIESGDEVLIMAHDLAPGVLGLAGLPAGRVLASVEGRAFEGLECAHPLLKRTSRGILAEYVTLEAGSGIVHIAPGHGLEDFASGVEYRLPVLAPVDGRGRFTAEYPEFEGVHVFEANAGIVGALTAKGALLHEGVIEHAYPFCWKCKNPVIFRATEQWFISLEHDRLKTRAAEAARGVTWFPPAGAERMGSMIDQRPDWCISRQRSWGVPIPVFYCQSCGQVLATEESLAAVRDWVAQEGADAWWSREAETLLPVSTRCPGCGGRKFRKETDTLDPWFDSGVTHTSVVRAREDLRAPADLYVEAVDQFRGWFQSSLLTSVALYGAAPYKAVLVSGWVLDPEGLKMSKSLGNVVGLDEAVGRWGADVMRLWTLSGNFHEDMKPTEAGINGVTDAYRKFRNTLRYLLGNLAGFDPAAGVGAPREVDRWMRWRLAALVADVTADMEVYAFHHAVQRIQKFCVVELSAFYLDLLKDRLYASAADDPERRAAQAVLAEIFSALVRMLGPFLPFTADEAWGHAPAGLTAAGRPLAAAAWPEPAPPAGAEAFPARWERFHALRDAVLKELEAARQAKTVESALAARVVIECDGGWREFAASLTAGAVTKTTGPGLRELLNVSQAELGPAPAAGAATSFAGPEGRLRVVVEKPPGAKCARCWLVLPEVGASGGQAHLCARCAAVVGRRGAA